MDIGGYGMNYRRFGATELQVSEIGFGGQSLGGGLYYRNDHESIATLHAALDAGITFYDTADHYSEGRSEELIGRAFQGRRDRVIIATKVGTRFSRAGRVALGLRPLLHPLSRWLRSSKIYLHQLRSMQKQGDFSPAYLRKTLEASLRRLQTDYVDVFQLHKPPSSLLEDGAWCDTMERFKAEGKIRHYGVACHHGPTMIEDAVRCLQLPGIASVQVSMSLVEQQAMARFLPQARARGVAVLIRNPRDQGHLTAAGSDIMAETYSQSPREAARRIERARYFRFLVRPQRTLAQAALQFLLQLDGVTTVLPRLFRREDLAEVLGTLTAEPLAAEELARISSVAEALEPTGVP